jgi:hypothetical protein
LMGECNRSYRVPRLGTLSGIAFAVPVAHIEPLSILDKPAHYT